MSDKLNDAEEMAYRALVDAASSLGYTLSKLPLPALTDKAQGRAFDNARSYLGTGARLLRETAMNLLSNAEDRALEEQVPPLSRGPWATP